MLYDLFFLRYNTHTCSEIGWRVFYLNVLLYFGETNNLTYKEE